jgi:hypothetical protein
LKEADRQTAAMIRVILSGRDVSAPATRRQY